MIPVFYEKNFEIDRRIIKILNLIIIYIIGIVIINLQDLAYVGEITSDIILEEKSSIIKDTIYKRKRGSY